MRYLNGIGLVLAFCLAGCSGEPGSLALGPRADQFKCAPDLHGAAAILEAINAHDAGDYAAATANALAVPPGTLVRIEAHTEGQSPKVRVRVLDGTFKGAQCWYPRNIDGLLAS